LAAFTACRSLLKIPMHRRLADPGSAKPSALSSGLEERLKERL